ncbi:putative iron binding protein from the HesB_IscA_SufA family [Paramagnetospirillum magnetotacticum MS-1]|uniref:Putative iron binding protein from the HesB_IscA_SufA family n=1 Tax=Paramagnetospirillum magnetotacticum MS-1 TaxID=272627 RepID=A0A0C2V1I3_PARME|nr:iron-sulfur cluster insertion protein ErpA [Paramagnetospirillum magnetotacticum]KIL98946.1 putative iron binding protein from the HesB_IscA_SufA family [Paramagnetospirillum magnetotacticum MS-1]
MAEVEHNYAARVTVTESAAERVQTLIKMEGKPNMMLRLGVSGGGCSGFSYGISLDDQVNDDDRLFNEYGITVVVDQTSLDMLDGSVVDFVEDLSGSSFQVKNPNATSTCGCGSSFSV